MIFVRKILLKWNNETPKFSRPQNHCPTQRAPDVWESARFLSIFFASAFFRLDGFAVPASAPCLAIPHAPPGDDPLRGLCRKPLGGCYHNFFMPNVAHSVCRREIQYLGQDVKNKCHNSLSFYCFY